MIDRDQRLLTGIDDKSIELVQVGWTIHYSDFRFICKKTNKLSKKFCNKLF